MSGDRSGEGSLLVTYALRGRTGNKAVGSARLKQTPLFAEHSGGRLGH